VNEKLQKTLNIKKNMESQEKNTDDEKKLLEILADMDNFKKEINEYSELVEVISFTHQFMNQYNLREDSYEKLLKSQIKSQENGSFIIETLQAKELNNQILNFVKEQQSICQKDERLLHSSEIIESAFGKCKHMENEQSHSNFTGFILSIGAIVSQKTNEVIKTALETVTNTTVNKWCEENIGENIKVAKGEIYGEIETKIGYCFCE
jgi:hypothetical protein